MRIYIIRHADPDYENDTITPEGHLEADALARRLESYNINRIYSSPLGRAIHTMEYTAKRLNKKAIILEWTRELSKLVINNTKWGELCVWDIPGEEILNTDYFPTHTNWHKLSYLINSDAKKKFEELKNNSDLFIQHHGYERMGYKYRCRKPNKESIVVFSHNGFSLSWIAHLLQIPLTIMWSGFWLAPSSVTTILFDQRSKEWAVPRCLGIGDVSHLYESELRIIPSGIKANYY